MDRETDTRRQPISVLDSVVQVNSTKCTYYWEYTVSVSCLIKMLLECGPMINVMAAQPNIGRALCESSVIPLLVPCPQSLADANYWSAVQ